MEGENYSMDYKSLKISNFRSINSLEADDFRRVNLITGRNNCGKTSFLEAIFLISGMSNPQLPITINNFRDLVLTSDEDFSFIFKDLNFNYSIEISAGINSHKRNIKIKPRFAQEISNKIVPGEKISKVNEASTSIISTLKSMTVSGLNIEFSESGKKYLTEFSLSENRVAIPHQYKENLHCLFYNTKLSLAQLDTNIEKLLVNKQLDTIISILKDIDNNIVDLRMGAGGMIYADIGLDKLIPANIMGDGIRRLLSIVASISNSQNGIVLIDEIENGFHYLSLEVLWKAVLKTAKLYNVQLFITTHSQECIAALSAAYGTETDDSIRLYRIEKTENKHRVFKYSPEMIAAGIENNYEVR
jgi:AAA15 family ATPase/GTPase